MQCDFDSLETTGNLLRLGGARASACKALKCDLCLLVASASNLLICDHQFDSPSRQVVIDRVRRSEDADNYMSPLLSEFSELRMAGDGAV